MSATDVKIAVRRDELGDRRALPPPTFTPNPYAHSNQGPYQPHDPNAIPDCSIPEAIGQQGLRLHSSSSSHRPQTKGDLQRVPSGHLLT